MADQVAAGARGGARGGLRRPLMIGALLAVLGGAGGFLAVQMGLLAPGAPPETAAGQAGPEPMSDVAFVPVPPLVISLGPAAEGRHLRFAAELEVPSAHSAEVAALMPRVLDLLNTYLRAVELRQLEDPGALVILRAQMLRRLQIVTGEGRVRDLLITEFVLN